MKKTMIVITGLGGLAAFAAGLTGTAQARQSANSHAVAVDAADALVEALDDVADIAGDLEAKAKRLGRHADAKAYGDLADSAATAAAKVERQILYPLLDGQTLAYAKAQLSRLKSAFNLVDSDAAAIYRMPYYLDDALLDVEYLKDDLADAVGASGRDRPTRPTRDDDYDDDGRSVVGF